MTRALRLAIQVLAVLIFSTGFAKAHVGSKDVFQTISAGPYTLYVTVRPPNVIPGVATVEIRSTGAHVSGIRITPLPLTGEAAKHPPAADTMKASSGDPSFFNGGVWMMATGTWQVRVQVEGDAGPQTASVPVLAVPITTLKMQNTMGFVLGALGLVLVLSMAAIVAASVRESRLRPGEEPTPTMRHGGILAMVLSLGVMLLLVILGGKWWSVEASDYAENVFSPATTSASLVGNQLDLRVQKVGSDFDRRGRSNSDYLPDHGHLMHLYAIREPEMDAAFHMHPVLVAEGDFQLTLPQMPPGEYRLYGDVVHATGFPETLMTSVEIPAGMQGAALDAEGASAMPLALSQGELGSSYKMPDGYTMAWEKPATLTAGTAYTFRFRLLDPAGKPATGMQPYLGMAGHAAFVKTDGSVFAHTHPEGTAAMADLMLANEGMGAQMTMEVSAEVSFPYGFPTAGRYRIFVQMKHSGTVETGVFDAEVR